MDNNFNFEDLKAWSEQIEPVFIVGPERSGTSMMFRTVVSHPSFCSFDNATVETFAFIRPQVLLDEAGPNNYEMRVYLGKKFDAFRSAVLPIIGLNKNCDSENLPLDYLGGNRVLRNNVWEKRNYKDLLRTFLYFSWINLGKKRLAEKTPAHVRCIDELFDCFPRAKVLVCLRDPAEIVASHKKRLKREVELGKGVNDPSLGWLKKNTDEYVKYFKLIENKIGMAEEKYTDQVIRVSYARATVDKAYLQSIFTFMGEEYITSTDNSGAAPDWDPLLSAAPQRNTIDVDRWLSEFDMTYLKSMSDFDSWM